MTNKPLLINSEALFMSLADESIHVCVTSPPYWALRVYEGAQARIWGGDPSGECKHEWVRQTVKFYKHEEPVKYANADDQKPSTVESAYCKLCNAWLGALGLEPNVQQYVDNMVRVGNEIMRVLHPSGTWWLVIGDCYSGSGGAGGDYNEGGLKEGQPRYPGRNVSDLKPKDLVGVPWRLAFALQERGWYLRSDIVWAKPNAMPESVTDRPTRMHEYVFLLTKSQKYYYDADAIREPHQSNDKRDVTQRSQTYRGKFDPKIAETVSSPRARQQRPGYTPSYYHPRGRNKRDVWVINTKPYAGSHFAAYPPDLVEPCIKAGSSEFGVCSNCGSPWKRVTEKEGGAPSTREERIEQGIDRQPASWGSPVGEDGETSPISGARQWRPPTGAGEGAVLTVGWEPTCNCIQECPDKDDQQHWQTNCAICSEDLPYPIVPARVLDPFNGTGTTLQVARALGRTGVGVDLSLEYLQQARKRLMFDKLDEWEQGKKGDSDLTDLPMFGGE